jgi:hypothetical protein
LTRWQSTRHGIVRVAWPALFPRQSESLETDGAAPILDGSNFSASSAPSGLTKLTGLELTNMMVGPARCAWRRYLRFTVRGLLVLVVVIGVWMGWLARSARIQREAVSAITRAGGSVTYDWEWRNGTPIPAGKPWAPQWLVRLIGVDYFDHVTAAQLEGSWSAADAAIVQVGRLTQLQLLYLNEVCLRPVRDPENRRSIHNHLGGVGSRPDNRSLGGLLQNSEFRVETGHDPVSKEEDSHERGKCLCDGTVHRHV